MTRRASGVASASVPASSSPPVLEFTGAIGGQVESPQGFVPWRSFLPRSRLGTYTLSAACFDGHHKK